MGVTVGKILEKVDTLKPNQFENSDKVQWIIDLESTIHEELMKTHEGWDGKDFDGQAFKNEAKQVTAQPPYDDIYVYYLSTQIDLYNRELNGYAQTAGLFNAAWTNYKTWYVKTHMPKQIVREFSV